MTIYVVRFSNYDPPEIKAIYTTREEAEKHVEALRKGANGWGWEVEAWEVRTFYNEDLEGD